MQITAAVTRHAGAPYSIERLALDVPRDDEVLVRIVATGLCHTDLVVRDQLLPAPLPAVLGHEGAGVVVETGRSVNGLAPGDHVVASFASCGECERCRLGEPGYCVQFATLNFGCRRADGSCALHDADGQAVGSHFFGQSSFASHALVLARNLVRVDKAVPLERLAPFGCGVLTGAGAVMCSFDAQPGSSFAVIGGGAVGLSAVLAAVARGCKVIAVVEPLAARRALALQLGATAAIDPAAGDVVEALRTASSDGIDYLLDTSGSAAAIEAAIGALAPRGAVGLVGVPHRLDATLAVGIIPLMSLGASVRGITEGDADPARLIPELVALHAAGRFPVDRLITTYPIERINDAVDDQRAGRCVKAVLMMEHTV